MDYREAIDWLFSTQMFGIKLGLEGPRRLLKEFLAFPAHDVKVIHVAGTNGKGSTCAMIDSIARACGRRSGLFTSPHLIDYRERIKVSGLEIPEDDCAAMLTELREICARMENHPTFFEISLALAMRWFRERECELIVLETGMGGRLDATTAVPADVCVVTPIGLDHMQWLGSSLEAIAAEKAGILSEGKPAVTAPQEAAARFVLEKEANEVRAPLAFVDEPLLGYPIALAGEHQKWNAALAVAALHRAGLPLNCDIVRHGLATVSWPGRFERVRPDVDPRRRPQSAGRRGSRGNLGIRNSRPQTHAHLQRRRRQGHRRHSGNPRPAGLADSFSVRWTRRAPIPADELAGCLPAGAPPHEVFESFEAAFAAAQLHEDPILDRRFAFPRRRGAGLPMRRRFPAKRPMSPVANRFPRASACRLPGCARRPISRRAWRRAVSKPPRRGACVLRWRTPPAGRGGS